jgi:hypothetical protein
VVNASDTLPWGSRVERVHGRPTRVCDRSGNEVCALQWGDDVLTRARLRLPSGRHIAIETDAGEHPLFGRVDRIRTEDDDGPGVTFCAVCWSAPKNIPPLDRPGALPCGAGTAVLNLIARRAADVDVGMLRYRGPYPTAALFDTLRASFRVHGDAAEAADRFCDDVEQHALRGHMREVAVDFQPAPHEWLFVHPRVCVQARSEIERIYVDGLAYTREVTAIARLRDDADALVATLEVAGRPWVDIASFDDDGTMRDGPFAVPAVESPLLGMELPRAVVDVLGEALCARAPVMLRSTLRDVFAAVTLRFADTGTTLARQTSGAIEVHALLGERLDDMNSRSQIMWLLAAVEPVAQRWAQRVLAEKHSTPYR